MADERGELLLPYAVLPDSLRAAQEGALGCGVRCMGLCVTQRRVCVHVCVQAKAVMEMHVDDAAARRMKFSPTPSETEEVGRGCVSRGTLPYV